MNKLDYYYENISTVRIEDKKNNRFTDCHLSVAMKNGRVRFLLTHDKGYPSENKGVNEKEVTANWISNNLPVV